MFLCLFVCLDKCVSLDKAQLTISANLGYALAKLLSFFVVCSQ